MLRKAEANGHADVNSPVPPEIPMKDTFRGQLLGYLLARASQVVSAGFMETLADHGMSVREWRVLGTLWDAERMTLGDLADAVLCEQSSTTRLVERLVGAGLVGKRADAGDRRRVHVSLTEEGRAVTAELVEAALAVERDVAGAYGGADTEALKKELHALIDRFS
jgi:DNA-binding MarR family transcriptional regulator